jgi:hypothetical protein
MADDRETETKKDGHRLTVDLTLPIPLLFAVLLQTCAIVWWASSLNVRMQEQERSAAFEQGEINSTVTALNSLTKDLIAIQERQNFVIKTLDDIQQRTNRNGDLLEQHTDGNRK